MPLNIRDVRGFSGATGRAGTPGASPTLPGANGEGGSNGRAGQAAELALGAQTFTGDAGSDSVLISYSAAGGRGGAGGAGAEGRDATVVTTFSGTANSNSTFNTFAGNTDGGFGGRGGAGGQGGVALSGLVFDLASAPGGADLLSFAATAQGGDGAGGGLGGFGGRSGDTAFSQRQIGVPGNYFTDYETTSSAATGQSGVGGISGVGGRGLVAFDTLSVTAGALAMRIDGLAVGGAGADGVNAVSHPNGAQPAAALAGGAGRIGGTAEARVAELALAASVRLDLAVTLEARGGQGGDGGIGAVASSSNDSNINLTNGSGTFTLVTQYAQSGNGGAGGGGGAALASFTDATIHGSGDGDLVDITLRAEGGGGGRGGDGSLGFGDSIVVSGEPAGILETRRIDGTPDGTDGVAGGAGRSVVTLTGNEIRLGDGNDRLDLLLLAAGSGARIFTVEGNVFDGGQGIDTLSIGDAFSEGQPDVLFNVQVGFFRVGSGPKNTMTGFEAFAGGTGDDRFVDGVGDQDYRGGFGADRFVCVSGRDGNDTIGDFDRFEDTIQLRGFGPALNDFADVLAAATQTLAGVLIQTSPKSSVLLVGVRVADLEANDFLF